MNNSEDSFDNTTSHIHHNWQCNKYCPEEPHESFFSLEATPGPSTQGYCQDFCANLFQSAECFVYYQSQ